MKREILTTASHVFGRTFKELPHSWMEKTLKFSPSLPILGVEYLLFFQQLPS